MSNPGQFVSSDGCRRVPKESRLTRARKMYGAHAFCRRSPESSARKSSRARRNSSFPIEFSASKSFVIIGSLRWNFGRGSRIGCRRSERIPSRARRINHLQDQGPNLPGRGLVGSSCHFRLSS